MRKMHITCPELFMHQEAEFGPWPPADDGDESQLGSQARIVTNARHVLNILTISCEAMERMSVAAN